MFFQGNVLSAGLEVTPFIVVGRVHVGVLLLWRLPARQEGYREKIETGSEQGGES